MMDAGASDGEMKECQMMRGAKWARLDKQSASCFIYLLNPDFLSLWKRRARNEEATGVR